MMTSSRIGQPGGIWALGLVEGITGDEYGWR